MSLKLVVNKRAVNKDVLKKPKVEVKMKPREAYHNIFFSGGRDNGK